MPAGIRTMHPLTMNSRAIALAAAVLTATPQAAMLLADEPRSASPPAEAARQPESAAARGDGGKNGGFPAEIELTGEQREKLDQLRARVATATAELKVRRATILSDEQKRLRHEIEQRIRAEGLDRQQAEALMATSLNLTPEQKTLLETTEEEAKRLRAGIESERMAVLTNEQRTTLRRLSAVSRVERMFQPPAQFKLDETQLAGLKAVKEEFGDQLATLTEQQEKLMTPERIAAREQVMQTARVGGMDRQAVTAAVDAALQLTDAEKAEMAATEASLRELRQKIQDRVLALLTPEQRQEFGKKFGAGR
jgi:Spy/CpxP family protein refolding chaperone